MSVGNRLHGFGSPASEEAGQASSGATLEMTEWGTRYVIQQFVDGSVSMMLRARSSFFTPRAVENTDVGIENYFAEVFEDCFWYAARILDCRFAMLRTRRSERRIRLFRSAGENACC